MPGRRLIPESLVERVAPHLTGPDLVKRRTVLRETIEAFENADPPDRLMRSAEANLARWRAERRTAEPEQTVRVVRGDWGDVALGVTREFGQCFAVLNMANAHMPGGGYVEGMVAQEENLFRRTNCHFFVTEEEFDEDFEQYHPEMTRLISGVDGRVYLDTVHPRVCIRGPEDPDRDDLGYPWLADDEIFPFYELRAAAQDLRDGQAFDPDEARRRIAAILDTVRDAGLRHVVLGAIGCGAFRNPPEAVAAIFKQEIDARIDDFSVIAFAIFSAGYSPGNYPVFAEAFQDT